MAIKKIKVTNFKSFKELEVELGDLNILIGANAAGKSNFIEIFRFLRDIKNSGLDDAISMQGGVEYLRNIKIGPSEDLSLEVTFDQKDAFSFNLREKDLEVEIYEAVYNFTIGFHKDLHTFSIVEDRLTQRCKFAKRREPGEERKELGLGEMVFSNVDGKIRLDPTLPGEVQTKLDNELPEFLGLQVKSLFLESPFFATDTMLVFHGIPITLENLSLESMDFGKIPIYDFTRGILRDAVSMAAKAELEENGSNLAVVLKNIMNKADGKRKLLNLVGYALPFVDDLAIEKLADKFLLFKLKEKYSDQYLPGFLLSDGTINTIALIVALYFEKQPLAIFEEPGRGIHPYLISEVIDMMRDASENKQIIATTHNPEMIRHANKDNILLISRNEEGFSTICRPSKKEDVNRFLENGMRMEELYVNDLLEL